MENLCGKMRISVHKVQLNAFLCIFGQFGGYLPVGQRDFRRLKMDKIFSVLDSSFLKSLVED